MSASSATTSRRDNTARAARGRRVIARIVIYGLLLAGAVFCLLPFYWLVRSAFMNETQIFTMPPIWFPDPITFQNFIGAVSAQPFLQYFLNTLTILVFVLPGTLLSCSAAAFAFSRLAWRGRTVVFSLVMSSLLLPYAVTLIPTFIGWQTLGLVDTYAPLTIPAFFAAGAGFNIFLLRQFFMQIPADLDNAMYVDGGSPWTVYWRIMLPLNKGPLTLVAIFTTIATWNDLLNPLIYISSPEKFTMSLGLAAFKGVYTTQWGFLMAASVLVILPIVALFFFAQRYIIEGIALTGLKG